MTMNDLQLSVEVTLSPDNRVKIASTKGRGSPSSRMPAHNLSRWNSSVHRMPSNVDARSNSVHTVKSARASGRKDTPLSSNATSSTHVASHSASDAGMLSKISDFLLGIISSSVVSELLSSSLIL